MDITARFRRPHYTGPNRCWPCTVVNIGILGLLVAVIWFIQPVLAAGVALFGLAGIWLRGYLIPYTPDFAPRLVARLPGDYFGPAPDPDSLEDISPDATNGEEILRALVDAGVLSVADDTVGLTAEFASSWTDHMEQLATASDNELISAVTRVTDGAASGRIETVGSETYVVVSESDGGSTAWLRRPVALAEIGAAVALTDTSLPPDHRELAAHALCAFLETCPECGDDIVEGMADDCCGHTVPDPGHSSSRVLACETCGVPFYTLESSSQGS